MLAESLMWDAAHASSIEPMTPCFPRANLVAPPHSTLRSSSAHAQTSSQQVPFRARARPQLVAPTNNIDNVVANVRLSLGEHDTGTTYILYFVAMVLTSRNASNDDLMRVGQRRSDFNQDLSEYLQTTTIQTRTCNLKLSLFIKRPVARDTNSILWKAPACQLVYARNLYIPWPLTLFHIEQNDWSNV